MQILWILVTQVLLVIEAFQIHYLSGWHSSRLPSTEGCLGLTFHHRCLTMMEALKSDSSSSSSSSNNVSKKRALYSFADARKIARNYGFTSQQEFLEYECPGAYQLPKNPQEVWQEEWQGWDDFLGVTLSFEEGRKVARALEGIATEETYLKLFEEKMLSDDDIASRLPYRPDLKYKDQWISWQDFLES